MATVKDFFDKAENHTLTWEQFEAAVKAANANFADLSTGEYVSKHKYDDDLASRDTQIQTLTGNLSTRDADLKKLQEQIKAAGVDDATKLSDITQQLSTLQGQYTKDTKALQDKLDKQAYEFAVREFTGKQNFSSEAAKRDFTSSMLAKSLSMENGQIIGATDFLNSYKGANADAFRTETPASTPAPTTPHPQFVGPTNPSTPQSSGNIFNFGFTGVRAHN